MRFRSRLNVVICLALLASAVSCGHMTPAGPTPTSLAVGSSGPRMFLGANETFTATITRSDATTAGATGAVWSTDAPTIATVDSTGRVTALASGSVTVIVDASGLRGTKTIRVLPNFGGNWQGLFAQGNCNSLSHVMFHVCTDIDDLVPRRATATFIQTGDSVSGTIAFGFLSATMTGTVAANGTLSFTAVTTPDVTRTYTGVWTMTCTVDGTLHGTVNFTGFDSAFPTDTFTMDGIITITRL